MKRVILVDFWRLRRMKSGEPVGRILFESFVYRAGTVYSPLYYLIRKGVVKREE